MICQGLSNQEITERIFLGMNTIKTYIRSTYRKINVTSRVRAVIWGLAHGFESDPRPTPPVGFLDMRLGVEGVINPAGARHPRALGMVSPATPASGGTG